MKSSKPILWRRVILLVFLILAVSNTAAFQVVSL